MLPVAALSLSQVDGAAVTVMRNNQQQQPPGSVSGPGRGAGAGVATTQGHTGRELKSITLVNKKSFNVSRWLLSPL